MAEQMKINDDVTVGPQPRDTEIDGLAKKGFRTIVNFRTDGEDDQPLSPEDEGEKVRAAGMQYVHIPVSMKSMRPELVDRFRDEFSSVPKPAFAHCKSGKRAGAMVMMHVACENGMSGEQTLKKAEEMGFECDQPELVDFVKSYVDNHSASS